MGVKLQIEDCQLKGEEETAKLIATIQKMERKKRSTKLIQRCGTKSLILKKKWSLFAT